MRLSQIETGARAFLLAGNSWWSAAPRFQELYEIEYLMLHVLRQTFAVNPYPIK